MGGYSMGKVSARMDPIFARELRTAGVTEREFNRRPRSDPLKRNIQVMTPLT